MSREAAREEARRHGLAIYEAVKARGVPQVKMARLLGWSAPRLSMTLKRIREGRFTLKTLAAIGLSVGVYCDLNVTRKNPPQIPPEPSGPSDGLVVLALAS